MRTCTVMIYTDGTVSRYAVMRGKMQGRLFDAHSAETIAVYEKPSRCVYDEETLATYREMTALHATPQAPAVRWQV